MRLLVGLFACCLFVAACSESLDDATPGTTQPPTAQPSTTQAATSSSSRSVDWVDGYQLGHLSCGYDPDQVYAESGTRDKRQAAERATETFTCDVAKGYTEGCVDALNGRPTKHP